ncbi:hypothetical protein MIC448_1260016 [Microbacterium sp. C448]|nr:hypothetical protein MIC448_1260016 [Microbacterium sp. C448]
MLLPPHRRAAYRRARVCVFAAIHKAQCQRCLCLSEASFMGYSADLSTNIETQTDIVVVMMSVKCLTST